MLAHYLANKPRRWIWDVKIRPNKGRKNALAWPARFLVATLLRYVGLDSLHSRFICIWSLAFIYNKVLLGRILWCLALRWAHGTLGILILTYLVAFVMEDRDPNAPWWLMTSSYVIVDCEDGWHSMRSPNIGFLWLWDSLRQLLPVSSFSVFIKGTPSPSIYPIPSPAPNCTQSPWPNTSPNLIPIWPS